jgi:hypothetical protein
MSLQDRFGVQAINAASRAFVPANTVLIADARAARHPGCTIPAQCVCVVSCLGQLQRTVISRMPMPGVNSWAGFVMVSF